MGLSATLKFQKFKVALSPVRLNLKFKTDSSQSSSNKCKII